MYKLLLVPVIVSLFIGCEPAVTFDEPQPDGINSLTAFPNRLQGDYLSTDKASILTINATSITRTYDYDFKVPKDSLDNAYKLYGDTLVNINTGFKQKITLAGDTIIQHIHTVDTEFLLSHSNILKKYKGYYFLNSLYKTGSWTVRKLYLNKGQLTVGYIKAKQILLHLNK